MNSIFADFLSTQSQANATTQHDAFFYPLQHYGLVRASGDDASSFLQNLLSNDIKQANSQQAQHSSFNTAKGRMLFNMLIWQDTNGDYLLFLPLCMCDLLCKRMGMYILRSKVKLQNISADFCCFGLSSNNASENTIIRVNDTISLCCIPNDQLQNTWQMLNQNARWATPNDWDLLLIRQGIPMTLPATQEQFVPQMVNFDLLGGINFKKGCYPGQEIVARTEYLGKIKRRMYQAHIDTANRPNENDPVHCASMPDQPCGNIVNVATNNQGGFEVLVVLHSHVQESGEKIYWPTLGSAILQF